MCILCGGGRRLRIQMSLWKTPFSTVPSYSSNVLRVQVTFTCPIFCSLAPCLPAVSIKILQKGRGNSSVLRDHQKRLLQFIPLPTLSSKTFAPEFNIRCSLSVSLVKRWQLSHYTLSPNYAVSSSSRTSMAACWICLYSQLRVAQE